MSAVDDLRAKLVEATAIVEGIKKRAVAGGDLPALADDLTRARTQREIVAERLAALEERERQAAAAKAAKEADRARAEVETALAARRDTLTEQWSIWGERMTSIDAELRELWDRYRVMSAAALALAHDARAAGIQLPGPDTGTAGEVAGRILRGDSPIRDWRR